MSSICHLLWLSCRQLLLNSALLHNVLQIIYANQTIGELLGYTTGRWNFVLDLPSRCGCPHGSRVQVVHSASLPTGASSLLICRRGAHQDEAARADAGALRPAAPALHQGPRWVRWCRAKQCRVHGILSRLRAARLLLAKTPYLILAHLSAHCPLPCRPVALPGPQVPQRACGGLPLQERQAGALLDGAHRAGHGQWSGAGEGGAIFGGDVVVRYAAGGGAEV